MSAMENPKRLLMSQNSEKNTRALIDIWMMENKQLQNIDFKI
jgi:hypothetical protein